MATHEFLDPATGTVRTLVVDETAAGEHGVTHDGCTDLGTVFPSLDAWQCSNCGERGRISGAEAMRLWFTGPSLDWAGA